MEELTIPVMSEGASRKERVAAREKYRLDLRNAVREVIQANELDVKTIVKIIQGEMEKEAVNAINTYVEKMPSFKATIDARLEQKVKEALALVDMKTLIISIMREKVGERVNEYLDKNLSITVKPETWA